MKISVLASGSKGNSTYIETEQTKILIDLGTSCLYTEKKLQELSVDPNEIEAILITHTHVDHINGLKVFIKKYKPMIYLSEEMHKELIEQDPKLKLQEYQYLEKEFDIKDLHINVFKTSHDTNDSKGYIFKNKEKSGVYVTDTGYINARYLKQLSNHHIYIMESNHDIELLMNGNRPYHIKQRILGDKGHLSNKDCSYYLSKIIGENTKNIILAHLSEDNNDPKLAKSVLETTLKQNNQQVNNIIIANQHDKTELIEVWK